MGDTPDQFYETETSDSEMYNLHTFECIFVWRLGVNCISHKKGKSDKLILLVQCLKRLQLSFEKCAKNR